jgi:hypothetical protein
MRLSADTSFRDTEAPPTAGVGLFSELSGGIAAADIDISAMLCQRKEDVSAQGKHLHFYRREDTPD